VIPSEIPLEGVRPRTPTQSSALGRWKGGHLDEGTGSHKRKTVLKTFRFSEELVLLLEKGAEKEGTTINALAGSILTQYLGWETKAKEFGFVPIYKPLFRAIFEALDDETLIRIGRKALPEMWKEMAEFWFQDSSADKILDIWSVRSRHLPYVQTEVKKQGNTYSIVFHHDLGPKWSIVIRSALDEMVRKSFLAQPTLTMGESIVTAQFSEPPRNSST